MVKHIVVYTLKEGVDKAEAVKIVASVLEPLVGKIPGLLKMEIRQCFQGSDYALYSEFESRELLAAYGGQGPGAQRRNDRLSVQFRQDRQSQQHRCAAPMGGFRRWTEQGHAPGRRQNRHGQTQCPEDDLHHVYQQGCGRIMA